MSTQTVHTLEDEFHRLQTPVPATGAEPFVGNRSVDDNIAECVQVALWGLSPGLRHRVQATIADGQVTLTGEVETSRQRGAAETAIFAIDGIVGITNFIKVSLVGATKQCDGP